MIIGEEERGNKRLRIVVQEFNKSEYVHNSNNITYSIYDPKFWQVFNEVGKVLFNNFSVTRGRNNLGKNRKVRVVIDEIKKGELAGESRTFSVMDASVLEVRNTIESAVLPLFE